MHEPPRFCAEGPCPSNLSELRSVILRYLCGSPAQSYPVDAAHLSSALRRAYRSLGHEKAALSVFRESNAATAIRELQKDLLVARCEGALSIKDSCGEVSILSADRRRRQRPQEETADEKVRDRDRRTRNVEPARNSKWKYEVMRNWTCQKSVRVVGPVVQPKLLEAEEEFRALLEEQQPRAASLLALKEDVQPAQLDTNELARSMANNSNAVNSSVNGSVNQTLEDLLAQNLKKELGGASVPNPEDSSHGAHSLGSLGANLEVVMLKLAELETIVGLQQEEIHKQEEIHSLQGRLKAETPATPNPSPSLSHQQRDAAQEARKVFGKAWKKKHQQRERRRFVTPIHSRRDKNTANVSKPTLTSRKEELVQRSSREAAGETSLDNSVSSKIIDDLVDGVEGAAGAVARPEETRRVTMRAR
ncbi:unnamed protein product [Effrenium voratum]|nr:unnamed protein product [Effrenium voratum]